jgi:hypothetical protein
MNWFQVTLPQANILHQSMIKLQEEFSSVYNAIVKTKGVLFPNVSLWASGDIYAGLNPTQVYYISSPDNDPVVLKLIESMAKKFNGVQCQEPDISKVICIAGDRNSLGNQNKE